MAKGESLFLIIGWQVVDDALTDWTVKVPISAQQHIELLGRDTHETALADTLKNVADSQTVTALPQDGVFVEEFCVHLGGILLSFAGLALFAFSNGLNGFSGPDCFFCQARGLLLQEFLVSGDLGVQGLHLFHDGDNFFLFVFDVLFTVFDFLEQGGLFPAGLNLHHL